MIYLDNAATSFPKAEGVSDAMKHYLDSVGGNPGRGSYTTAVEAGMDLLKLRRRAHELFNAPAVDHVVVTPGQTASLNQCIKGFLSPGDEVVVGSLEHNSVMRPLNQLKANIVRLPFNRQGFIAQGPHAPAAHGAQLESIVESSITPATKLIIMSHASNVCGSIADVATVGAIARSRQIPFVIDAAQTAGHIPLDFETLHASALCLPGHKGLLGPQGIGLCLMAPDFASRLEPLITGGTGSASDLEVQPDYMPDKFESGTQNMPGVCGLRQALSHLDDEELARRRSHEMNLSAAFIEGLCAAFGTDAEALHTPGGHRSIYCAGSTDVRERVGVFSLDFPTEDNAEVAFRLEHEKGILTRCGLHCAPHAHKTLQTFPQGSVRVSFGAFTTHEDVDAIVAALAEIIG